LQAQADLVRRRTFPNMADIKGWLPGVHRRAGIDSLQAQADLVRRKEFPKMADTEVWLPGVLPGAY